MKSVHASYRKHSYFQPFVQCIFELRKHLIYNFAFNSKEKERYLDNLFSITYHKFLHNILHNICRHTDQTQQHILPFCCTGSHQMENKQPLHKKWKVFLKTISKNSLIIMWLTLVWILIFQEYSGNITLWTQKILRYWFQLHIYRSCLL